MQKFAISFEIILTEIAKLFSAIPKKFKPNDW